jgi:hypothetical protein
MMSGTWADDDTIYAVLLDTSGLASIPAGGGPPKEISRSISPVESASRKLPAPRPARMLFY